MRLFLDVFVKGEDGQIPVGHLDVTDLNEKERAEDIADTKILYPDARLYWHYCRHDEDESCQLAEVK